MVSFKKYLTVSLVSIGIISTTFRFLYVLTKNVIVSTLLTIISTMLIRSIYITHIDEFKRSHTDSSMDWETVFFIISTALIGLITISETLKSIGVFSI